MQPPSTGNAGNAISVIGLSLNSLFRTGSTGLGH
jgi:hypothetical protein